MGFITSDPCAVRSKARADVAELCVKLSQQPTPEEENIHVINIATKKALTITEFKQMFYARGDDEFCIANIYEHPNNAESILASVWGKRTDSNNCNPCSEILNYNKLGGRNNNPPTTFLAYVYENDRQRTFYAQEEVMGNIERDICEGRGNWSMCSRAGIFDSLYNPAILKSPIPRLLFLCNFPAIIPVNFFTSISFSIYGSIAITVNLLFTEYIALNICIRIFMSIGAIL